MGGQRYWNDGRDVYDVIFGLLDYPDTDASPGFTLSLQTNFEDGGGDNALFRFVGSEGAISVSFTELTLSGPGIVAPTADQVLKGYNSARTFSKAQQKELAEVVAREGLSRLVDTKTTGKPARDRKAEKFVVPKGYDERFDHFVNFFKSVRGGSPVYEDAVFGLRAAAPALLCNDSYRQGKVIGWDPVGMRVVS
jgi:hypothetical protein